MTSGAAENSTTLRHEVHQERVVRCHVMRPPNIFAMFAESHARAPRELAIVDGGLRLSYDELDRLVTLCAARLFSVGVEMGDRVAILLGNRVDFIVTMLAVARLGAISVPMNVRQKRPEIGYALTDSGSKVLIHEVALEAELPDRSDTPGTTQRIAVDDSNRVWDFSGDVSLAPPPAAPGEDSPFCILYTSGTTGRPKGAVLTHFSTLTSCLGAEQSLGLRDGERTILTVPASHVTGTILVLLLMIRVAGSTVIQANFKASEFLQAAADERISYAIMVPSMYSLCLMEPDVEGHDLSAWRIGAYGGAPMPESVIERLAAVVPGMSLVNIYGATETSSPAVMMPAGEGRVRTASVGRALPYCDLLIMDEQGREVAPGDQGEIWLAGPMLFSHYWNNQQATTDAMVNGYWKSGDIGSVDRAGFLQLHDRKKDMINRGGYKIYSAEVENVLTSHPAIIEAGVVGYPCPVLGERVAAFVVTSGATSETELRDFCGRQLSDYKVPEKVFIVTEGLPRNANGKLLKIELRTRVAAMLAGRSAGGN